jgi:hypothetical protein
MRVPEFCFFSAMMKPLGESSDVNNRSPIIEAENPETFSSFQAKFFKFRSIKTPIGCLGQVGYI